MKTFIFVLTIALITSTAAAAVNIGTVDAACGATASVPVSVDSVSGMLAAELRVSFDPQKLTPTGVTAGSLTSGFSISHNVSGGEMRIAMASGTSASGSGTIAVLAFNVAASAPAGIAPLTRVSASINDVATTGASGGVQISCGTIPAGQAVDMFLLPPCRVHDTRGASGPILGANSERQFTIAGRCGVPAAAKGVIANFTVTENRFGYLTIWPTGSPRPVVSTINYQAGTWALANGAIMPLGTGGAISVLSAGEPTHLVIDVTGYLQ